MLDIHSGVEFEEAGQELANLRAFSSSLAIPEETNDEELSPYIQGDGYPDETKPRWHLDVDTGNPNSYRYEDNDDFTDHDTPDHGQEEASDYEVSQASEPRC